MIKVGYLVSYDYYMLLTSIKQVYSLVDEFYLAIDKDRKTWSGNGFEIPELFFVEIKEFDKQNKIKFYFDKFYISNLTPMECETRQRNLLSKKMGKGWLIQLDVDEYVYDFEKLVQYLNKYWFLTIFPKLTPVTLNGKWITLYKKLHDGYLFIENDEQFPFVTNIAKYNYARGNSENLIYGTNTNVIHQSWARSEDEIQQKINNWSHKDDFDTQKYFHFWQKLTSSNYKDFQNIHPISPKVWDKLCYLPCNSIDDYIDKYSLINKQVLAPLELINIFKTRIYDFLIFIKEKIRK